MLSSPQRLVNQEVLFLPPQRIRTAHVPQAESLLLVKDNSAFVALTLRDLCPILKGAMGRDKGRSTAGGMTMSEA